MAAGALAVVAVIVASLSASRPAGDGDRVEVPVSPPEGYPAAWKTSLSVARRNVTFHLPVPDTAAAHEGNIDVVYVWPDASAVVMRFPSARSSSPPVRQEYLEVYVTTWGHGDPMAEYRQSLEEDPSGWTSIYNVDGVAALGVLPRSPEDVERANPAYLELVIDGLEVEISGGDDMDLLIDIAWSMLEGG